MSTLPTKFKENLVARIVRPYISGAVRLFRPLALATAENLPALTVAGSIAGFVAGVMWFPSLAPYQPLFLALGSGGLFGWLSKTVTFKKVLQDVVFENSYSEKQLSRQSSVFLEDLLIRIVVALGIPKDIAEMSRRSILERLWRPDKPYFYKDIHRRHWLEWIDKESGLVSVKTEYIAHLVNTQPDQQSDIRQALYPEVSERQTPPVLTRFEMTDLNNDNNQTVCTSFSEIDTDDGKKKYEILELLPAGAKEVKVHVEWSYTKDIQHDNMITFVSRSFCCKMRTEVSFDAKGMNVAFSTVGPVDVEDNELCSPTHRDGRPQIDKISVKGSLIMPENGYILSIQRWLPPSINDRSE